MGAHSFIDTTDQADPRQGFTELREAALSEYGSDPYNGTISTVGDFSRSNRYPGPVPSSCLELLDRKVWEDEQEGLVPEIQKWESCLAVPLAEPDDFQWEERSFTFEVEAAGNRSLSTWEARPRVIERLGAGEWAADIKLEKLTPDRGSRIQEEETAPGETVGFTIATVNEGGPSIGGMNAGRIYETREAAVDVARRMAGAQDKDYTVLELRSGGFTCGQVKALDLYRVTYRVPLAISNPEVSGWAFIGLAAS